MEGIELIEPGNENHPAIQAGERHFIIVNIHEHFECSTLLHAIFAYFNIYQSLVSYETEN